MIGEKKKEKLVYPPSEKEIRRRLEETERGENPSFIEIWRKRYVYRGIPYEIACVKHVGKKWNKAGMHCVLEPTEEWEDVWGSVQVGFDPPRLSSPCLSRCHLSPQLFTVFTTRLTARHELGDIPPHFPSRGSSGSLFIALLTV